MFSWDGEHPGGRGKGLCGMEQSERITITRRSPLNHHAEPATPPVQGARRLLLAVLELAITDLGRPAYTLDARRYFASEDASWLYAYRAICDELDLHPATVTAWMEARLHAGALAASGVTREHRLAGRALPQRRLLSATIGRVCCACGVSFVTHWAQQRACSNRCNRRWKKAQARLIGQALTVGDSTGP